MICWVTIYVNYVFTLHGGPLFSAPLCIRCIFWTIMLRVYAWYCSVRNGPRSRSFRPATTRAVVVRFAWKANETLLKSTSSVARLSRPLFRPTTSDWNTRCKQTSPRAPLQGAAVSRIYRLISCPSTLKVLWRRLWLFPRNAGLQHKGAMSTKPVFEKIA